LEVLITILVVIVMVLNLRASLLISTLLPLAVLMVFIAMHFFGVDANIVALSGIAIAIGTMVDLGIILSENIIRHIKEAPPEQKLFHTVYQGASEVGSAILTAVSTTVVSFIPVFTLEAAEGKLFHPLAYTKTFALIAALIVSLLILPTLACWFFGFSFKNKKMTSLLYTGLAILGFVVLIFKSMWLGFALIAYSAAHYIQKYIPVKSGFIKQLNLIITLLVVSFLLAKFWLPLGPRKSLFINYLFTGGLIGMILGAFALLEHYYRSILEWCLNNKALFLSIPLFFIFIGTLVWFGFHSLFGFAADGIARTGWDIRTTSTWNYLDNSFPGMGKEFMPSLDEGSFLLMPTSMPHSGFTFNKKIVGQLDILLANIPEVEMAVGKLGRVSSALDPAPISMYENIINYKPEYKVDEKGHRQRFKVNNNNHFILKDGRELSNQDALFTGINSNDLIPDEGGIFFRNWRDHIHSPDDIWEEISKVTQLPGVTSAPKLQPIETRLVMLQTGMRAPMGIKVYGPDLETIEEFGQKLESILKKIPSVKQEAVFADRIVGKPYIQFDINRNEIARYGLTVDDIQQVIETAVGGMKITSTVEGRERYAVRMRYPRELRDNPEALSGILIPTPGGAQIPIGQLVDIEYKRGPQAIKSEDTFLVGYVLFDMKQGHAEVDVVNDAKNAIEGQIERGELSVPSGVSFKFSGNYENQIRAENRLSLIVPLVLFVVFIILYFQFKSLSTSLMVFSGIAMAFSGGFIVLWLYGQEWFMNFSLFETNLRDLFQMGTVNLSVAVWVGFIALFGIATDDGVLIATYLKQSFETNMPTTKTEIREAVIDAGLKRIKPALMTVSTTIIALLPVLT
ncbi:MAG: efflux RND transporter permease subunit, partial [Cyclobacteriaceae bacterium]|nr:efflux RND transporter permease subunit [Cyclobacteriaceae bacterium]